MKRIKWYAALLCVSLLSVSSANAAFIVYVDIDGTSAGNTITYNPLFTFGGDTTTASVSARSTAVGTVDHNSIFGGDGAALPDQYNFSYSPGTHGDNVTFNAGDPLNDDGHVASGIPAGNSGLYNIYATWPSSANITGGPTRYVLTDDLSNEIFNVVIDTDTVQGTLNPNDNQIYTGNEWILINSNVALDASRTYTLSQTPTVSNSFVSMRAAAIMFDAQIPEPATLGMAGLALVGFIAARRKMS